MASDSTLRNVRLWCLLLLVHVACLAVYILPVLLETKSSNPVLDENHIVTEDNRDVNGATTLADIWKNDYWGRPLDSPSSHKSWRPFTILSFRYLGGQSGQGGLRMHRLVNIITHAAAAHLIGILTVQFYRPLASRHQATTLRAVATLVFALHPAHVEITANAANRPHLLAVLCSLLCASPSTHYLWFTMALIVGLLASETFLFQLPAIAVTHLLVLSSKRNVRLRSILATLSLYGRAKLLPRWTTMAITGGAYLYYRFCVLTNVSIPDGLIRPAENPFFDLRGWERFYSYTYSWAIHVTKQWDFDVIGMSHEYGYNCIPSISNGLEDLRWVGLVGAVVALHVWAAATFGTRRSWWLYLVWSVASWIPVSGILKVGTFVSDRIVAAATVPVSMVVSMWWTEWFFCRGVSARQRSTVLFPRWYRVGWALFWALLVYARVHQRCLEWMDSMPLLQSSLRTCPNFAKAHLEMSKIHSGLYPEHYNLRKAKYHLKRAAEIDPSFCDVHYQLAFVALKQGIGSENSRVQLTEIEEHLLEALQCPFTMGQAIPLWQQYWQSVLDPSSQPESVVESNRKRYEKYQRTIQEKIQKESEQENQQGDEQQQLHPFAWKG